MKLMLMLIELFFCSIILKQVVCRYEFLFELLFYWYLLSISKNKDGGGNVRRSICFYDVICIMNKEIRKIF